MSRDVGDATVLLNLSTGTYLSVSGSGGELWRLYAAEGYEAAVSSASARFGVPADRIRADLDHLLHDVEHLRAPRGSQRVRRRPLPWGRARTASLPELTALVRAGVLVAAVEVGLRRMPVPRLAGALGVRLAAEPETAPAPTAQAPELTARERADLLAAERVFRYWLFEATCLRRALVAGRQLRRRGAVLHLGVADSRAVGRAPDGPIAAHAWVDAGGVRLLALPGYHRLVSAAHD